MSIQNIVRYSIGSAKGGGLLTIQRLGFSLERTGSETYSRRYTSRVSHMSDSSSYFRDLESVWDEPDMCLNKVISLEKPQKNCIFTPLSPLSGRTTNKKPFFAASLNKIWLWVQPFRKTSNISDQAIVPFFKYYRVANPDWNGSTTKAKYGSNP